MDDKQLKLQIIEKCIEEKNEQILYLKKEKSVYAKKMKDLKKQIENDRLNKEATE